VAVSEKRNHERALDPLLLVVGTVSVVRYRLQNRRPRRRWSTDGGGVDFSSNSGSGGWSFSDWFSSTDGSGNPVDNGGWDSGGGGDSGGSNGGGGD
jgi:hypothetical protein